MSMGHWNTREGILDLLLRLVRVPSVTGTRGELRMEEEIVSILMELPYYQKQPEYIFKKAIRHDALDRKAVACLYKGNDERNRTIILLSHYDVVGVEDFGRLTPLAFSPMDYTRALEREELPKEAKEDLQSGEWIFGRGIMDMKAGLAVQLALISEVCKMQDLSYNLLLLATPDEERYSAGMFAGVELLDEIRAQFGLNYELTICSEPSFGAYPGDRSKYFYTGSVGKMLPLIYCTGTETHVGEPLEGLNAAWMASVFSERSELSADFLESSQGERNPLPTTLKLTDLKESYDVQTPTNAYILLNILTLRQSPEDVMSKLKNIGRESSEYIGKRLMDTYQSLGYQEGAKTRKIIKPKVYTYWELYEKGLKEHGSAFRQAIEGHVKKLEQDLGTNMGKLTAAIAGVISSYFKHLAPFYLIMLSPPFYPHVYLKEDEKDEKARGVVMSCIAKAKKEYNEEIGMVSYFQGLSDVSYFRLRDKEKVSKVLEKEMPLYGAGYDIPLELIAGLDVPAVNIGPYGKDAHKRTERLHIPFSTEVLPALLKHAVYSC